MREKYKVREREKYKVREREREREREGMLGIDVKGDR